jgi:hypothetical protein
MQEQKEAMRTRIAKAEQSKRPHSIGGTEAS